MTQDPTPKRNIRRAIPLGEYVANYRSSAWRSENGIQSLTYSDILRYLKEDPLQQRLPFPGQEPMPVLPRLQNLDEAIAFRASCGYAHSAPRGLQEIGSRGPLFKTPLFSMYLDALLNVYLLSDRMDLAVDQFDPFQGRLPFPELKFERAADDYIQSFLKHGIKGA